MGGSALLRNLVNHLGDDQPVYGIFEQDVDSNLPLHTSMDEVVAHCLQGIRSVQAQGPYLIGGLCFGGFVSLELARVLQEEGEQVDLLFMVEAYVPGSVKPKSLGDPEFGNTVQARFDAIKEEGLAYF